MTHPHEDQLLLFAYGEGEDDQDVEMHVATCASCQQALGRLERGRVALEMAFPKRPGRARWLATGLAAAVVAAVLLTRGGSHTVEPWQPPHVWSPTAGYIAGGQPLVEIDAQLTRLEQERSYVRP